MIYVLDKIRYNFFVTYSVNVRIIHVIILYIHIAFHNKFRTDIDHSNH